MGSTSSPVSSQTSRTTAWVTDSPGSTLPPGRPQSPLSSRRWRRTPSGPRMTAATPGRMTMRQRSGRDAVRASEREGVRRSAAALELPCQGQQSAADEPRVESERGAHVLERVGPVLAALHHPATGLDCQPRLVLGPAADRAGETADGVGEDGAEERPLAAPPVLDDGSPGLLDLKGNRVAGSRQLRVHP